MSAPAIKSSMPGVGASPSSAGHSVLPMNMMAQKVVPGTESNSGMKPLNTSGLSYVTLQPPNHPQQPLSLVQDHRPPVYQAQPSTYTTNNAEKETDSDKVIANGVESSKVQTEQEQNCPIKSSEPSRNNNMSPETPSQEQQTQDKKQLESQSEAETAVKPETTPVVGASPQSKIDEKKSPINNGSKETEVAAAAGGATTTTLTPGSSPSKTVPTQKTEESPAKSETQKPKVPSPVAKPSATESTVTTLPKLETKVASTTRATKRKPKELKDLKSATASGSGGGGPKPKRNRIKTQPYQSPLPEIAMIVKTLNKPVSTKAPDDKLIVFYKNEFLAVRNTEGSFFVCQAMQNIYKSSKRIRIRWLSQDKNNGEIYSPDFYDHTDFDCILTNLNLNKVEKNKYQLTKLELLRTENILKRGIDGEAGVSEKPRVTEEHPDGLDLSLFKDESQLKKRKSGGGSGGGSKQKRQRKKGKRESSDSEDDDSEEDSDDDDNEDNDDDDDDDDDDDNDEKPEPKANATKKRSNNKALAIAKSMAKGPSRKERAMNRSNKIAAEEASSSSSPGKSDSASKKSVEVKKDDPKKVNKPQSNNTSGVSKAKARGGAMQKVQESKSTTSRPKRVLAATTGVQPNTEEASSRKKSRGRA